MFGFRLPARRLGENPMNCSGVFLPGRAALPGRSWLLASLPGRLGVHTNICSGFGAVFLGLGAAPSNWTWELRRGRYKTWELQCTQTIVR